MRTSSDVSIATVTPVFRTAIMTTHHPYLSKGVRRAGRVGLALEFLPIYVFLAFLHHITSREAA